MSTTTRKKKFVALLRNHTSRDDDEPLVLWALDYKGAEEEAQRRVDRSRFSIRTILTAKQARSRWA